MCTQYFGKMIGESFAKIVNKDFPKTFRDNINPKNKQVLQDGNPIQYCKKANRAFDAIGCKLFAIPAWSPDVNPIKNIFNWICEKLTKDDHSPNQTRKFWRVFCSCKKNICRVSSQGNGENYWYYAERNETNNQ